MSKDTIEAKATLSCMKCGHQGVSVPENPTDGSLITCPACGAELSTYGQLKAKIESSAVDTVREKFEQTLRDAFKGSSNIKINF